jgi:hypothetical protein
MWLKWQAAVVIAVVGLVVGLAWWRAPRPWQRNVASFGREMALVLALYVLWIQAGRLAVVRVDEGLANGTWVYDLQRTLHLPSEAILQDWILPHPWVARFTNAYYAVVHVPAMVCALLWLFLARRERYRPWRRVLAMTTFACLLIQYVPVAPPRMYPQYGFVDVAALYGQSVYGAIGQGISDQLSAMPSVHVAWAVWVGVVVVDAAVTPWRWLVLGHPAATVFAVTATSNHWWLDGVVAAGLLVLAVVIEVLLARWWWRRRGRRQPPDPPSSRRAVPPRNSAIASSSSGSALASVSERRMGNHGSSLPHSTRPR